MVSRINKHRLLYQPLTQYTTSTLDISQPRKDIQLKEVFPDDVNAEEYIEHFINSKSRYLVIDKSVFNAFGACFIHVSKLIIKSMRNEEEVKKRLKQLASLRHFLLADIANINNCKVINQHSSYLINEIKVILKMGHEEMIVSNAAEISELLCYCFQTLTILVAVNERANIEIVPNLIKTAVELIKDYLKKSYSNDLLKQVYSYGISQCEEWEIGIKSNERLAVAFERKKFSLIQLTPEAPVYSLRYMLLYFLSKPSLFNIIADQIDKALISTILLIQIKDLSATHEEETNTELKLNEALVCMKFIKRVLIILKDSLIILETKEGLRELIINSIISAVNNEKVAFIDKWKKKTDLVENFSNIVSYKTSNDYIAIIFKFLNETGSILPLFIEDTIINLINILNTIKGKEKQIRILKTYIVELLFDKRRIIIDETVECFICLIGSNTFHFTSPKSLPPKLCELEDLMNKRVVILLGSMIESKAEWAKKLLEYFIEQLSTKKAQLFGLCRLIYCSLTGKLCDNELFYNRFFNSKEYTVKYEKSVESNTKAVEAFVDIEGINTLMNILIKHSGSIALLESLLLELSSIKQVSEQLLKEPQAIIQFIALSNNETTSLALTNQLLQIAKHNQLATETNYFPLSLIKFIRDSIISKEKSKSITTLPLMKLMVQFLSYEPGLTSLKNHQLILSKNMEVDNFFEVMVNNKELVKEHYESFLMLLGGLQRDNDEVAKSIDSLELIAKKKLYRSLKCLIKQKVLDDLDSILQIFIELTFEIATPFLKPTKALIKRRSFFIIYISILRFLTKSFKYRAIVAKHIKELYDTIHSSYWNNSMCKSPIFEKLVKIAKHLTDDKTTVVTIIKLCEQILINTHTNKEMKAFFTLFNNEDVFLLESILILTPSLLSAKAHNEIFVFSGNEGIILKGQDKLPAKGFGFCGVIRIERKDQSTPIESIIFKLSSSKEKEIEFFISDGYLNYKLKDIKRKEVTSHVIFTDKKLEDDKWHFIELYHMNNNYQNNLQLYINKKLVRQTSVRKYDNEKAYDTNTIGCELKGTKYQKQFKGEMSALCFFDISYETLSQVHNFICSTVNHFQPPIAIETTTKEILSEVWMYINPKYTEIEEKLEERVYYVDNIDIINNVKKSVIVEQESKINEAFFNAGGIEAILPALYNIANSSSDELKYI